jgi:hypothetical protein
MTDVFFEVYFFRKEVFFFPFLKYTYEVSVGEQEKSSQKVFLPKITLNVRIGCITFLCC